VLSTALRGDASLAAARAEQQQEIDDVKEDFIGRTGNGVGLQ
jgi:hypothetical protein